MLYEGQLEDVQARHAGGLDARDVAEGADDAVVLTADIQFILMLIHIYIYIYRYIRRCR